MSLNQLVDSRDVRFILFEMLELEKLNRFERFNDFDKTMYDDTLNLAEKIAIDQFYPSNADGDKTGLQFNPKTNEVKVPESFHKGFKAYVEAGFHTFVFSAGNRGNGHALQCFHGSSGVFQCGQHIVDHVLRCNYRSGVPHCSFRFRRSEKNVSS